MIYKPNYLQSNLSRRRLLKINAGSAGTFAVSSMIPGMAMAAGGDISLWGIGTLDIADKWQRASDDAGLMVSFTDNANDPGPNVARLVAGNANPVYDVSGLQGGAERELAAQGAIDPAAVATTVDHVRNKFSGKVYWQNTRPDNVQLYEE